MAEAKDFNIAAFVFASLTASCALALGFFFCALIIGGDVVEGMIRSLIESGLVREYIAPEFKGIGLLMKGTGIGTLVFTALTTLSLLLPKLRQR